jgi:hypothetical protein
MEEGKNAFKILTDTPTGKRPLGTSTRRCEHNIRINLKEIDISMRNWIDSAQDRDYWRALVNAALNLRFHKPWSQLLLWSCLLFSSWMCKWQLVKMIIAMIKIAEHIRFGAVAWNWVFGIRLQRSVEMRRRCRTSYNSIN